jgi:oleate hydratase
MDRTFMNQPDLSNINTSHLKNQIDAMAAQFINITPDASNTHLHNGIDTRLSPADLKGAYCK